MQDADIMNTLLAALDRAILASAASTGVDTRTAVADYGRALTRHASTANPFTGALEVWVEKVARHAYQTLPMLFAAGPARGGRQPHRRLAGGSAPTQHR
jgi:hypothetical protein